MVGTGRERDAPPGRIDAAELEAFAGSGASRQGAALERVARGGWGPFHWTAAAVGPLWAAWRGSWFVFWPALGFEIGACALAAHGLALGALPGAEGATGQLALALAVLAAGRALLGLLAWRSLWQLYLHWRQGRVRDGAPSRRGLAQGATALAGFGTVSVLHFGGIAGAGVLGAFPTERFIQRGVAGAIDRSVDWMTLRFEALFDAITLTVREMLEVLEAVFLGLPWPVVCGLVVLAAWRLGGWKVCLFAAASLLYLGLFGYWEKSMSTLSLVGASAFFCFAIGMPLGVLCGKRPRLYDACKPALDFMQVMPTFVYLIPAVAFFSIGKPPGVLATVIFAMPPMIRLTALGIQQVPESVREAGTAFGASSWQLLAKVELPLAVPSIMTGINQTIMMCLSMVIVASMIGAGGLGYDVLVALRHLKTGEGFLAGMAIVVCAMLLDRIIQGGGRGRRAGDGG